MLDDSSCSKKNSQSQSDEDFETSQFNENPDVKETKVANEINNSNKFKRQNTSGNGSVSSGQKGREVDATEENKEDQSTSGRRSKSNDVAGDKRQIQKEDSLQNQRNIV